MVLELIEGETITVFYALVSSIGLLLVLREVLIHYGDEITDEIFLSIYVIVFYSCILRKF